VRVRVQGFQVTIHCMRTETGLDTLVIEGGGQSFQYHGRHTPRTLSSGEIGVALLLIHANRFVITFSSDGSITDEGFELSYTPYLGAVLCRPVSYLTHS
jgi:hypothetical protein